jgi:hypothetical protein
MSVSRVFLAVKFPIFFDAPVFVRLKFFPHS